MTTFYDCINPCELESPGSRRGRNAEFAGGRVLKGSHRLLPVGAPLLRIRDTYGREGFEMSAVFTQQGSALEPSLFPEKGALLKEGCSFPPAPGGTIKTLDECEKEIIAYALARLNGNLTQTAKALAISFSTLKRKIRKYHINKMSNGPE
jgi:hypothetical protein